MHSAAKMNEKRCGQLPTRVLVAACAYAAVFAAHDANAVTTAKSYIQGGLVAHWDAIENAGYGQHDATTNMWTDLKGYCDLTILNDASSWTDDAFVPRRRTMTLRRETRQPR